MKKDPLADAVKIKSATRGRRKAFCIPRTHCAPPSERRKIDLDALASVWGKKLIEPPPATFLERLGDLCEGQAASTRLSVYISTDAPTGKAIDKVRVQAERLAESLEALSRLEGGHAVVEALGLDGKVFWPDELREAIRCAFRIGDPAEFYRVFICRVRDLFDDFDQNVAIHENSLFINALKEIDQQLPGLARSADSVSTLWRNHVETALKSKKAALRNSR